MIGLFDSGSGGLSVLGALRGRAPYADICYFGDIANAPYGVRPAGELIKLTEAGVKRLRGMGATEIVSACNSVSPAILAGAAGDVPTVEMTVPASRGMRAYAGKRVLLIATPATIASGIYERALQSIVTLDSLPIPELAGAIEFGAPDAEVAKIACDAFSSRVSSHYDVLLFGCTHYPLARDVIEKEAQSAFGKIVCIDPAEFVAEDVVQKFDCNGTGIMHFAVSKDSKKFRDRVIGLFPSGGYTIELI